MAKIRGRAKQFADLDAPVTKGMVDILFAISMLLKLQV
jgi:hypothetical protein